jgi:carboxypeptidase Taq
MEKSVPDFWGKVGKGEFAPIRGWLNRNLHVKGRLMRAEDMMRSLTGEGLNAEHYVRYLKEKFGPIYKVKL